jgi:hypothetical protein
MSPILQAQSHDSHSLSIAVSVSPGCEQQGLDVGSLDFRMRSTARRSMFTQSVSPATSDHAPYAENMAFRYIDDEHMLDCIQDQELSSDSLSLASPHSASSSCSPGVRCNSEVVSLLDDESGLVCDHLVSSVAAALFSSSFLSADISHLPLMLMHARMYDRNHKQ